MNKSHTSSRESTLKPHLVVSLLIFFLVVLLFSVGYLSAIQRTLIDNVYGRGSADQQIVIIAIDDSSLQELGRWPWNRSRFAEMVEYLGDARLVGIDVGFFEPSPDDSVLDAALQDADNVVLAMEYTDFDTVASTVTGRAYMLPVVGNVSAGYINVLTDRDGVTRALHTDVRGEFESFPAIIATRAFGRVIEPDNRFLINFVGGPGSYVTYSFADVLQGRVSRETFSDKVVLIGATSPDLHDEYFVPTSRGKAMPGVEILANAVQTMVLGNELREQSAVQIVLVLFLLILLTGLGFAFLRIRTMTVLALLAAFLWVLLAIYAFTHNVLLNVVYPPFALAAAFTGNLGYAYSSRKKQRDELKRAFSKYVRPAVIKEVLKDPDKLKLGGQRREITVFFSDIRGFTGISERLSAEQLVGLLNEYLTEMTDIIIDEGGTIDKYMGDAIMAFWNAPLDQPDHPERACRATLKMIRRLKELQADWTRRGIPALAIGAGLNTGDVIVGNMGSTQRFDYTVMGDTVNLGSRLEGVNKPYGTTILISEMTYARVKELYVTRKLDRIRVKGRTAPLTIYELVEEPVYVTDADRRVIALFEEGLELYFKQCFSRAIKKFKEVLEIREWDGPAHVFVKRCQNYLEEPPEDDWDGVFTLKTK
ncbi:CHASE2 domain-containing protein [Candidatus Woesearchaeota archaeon]|nr:CHASE2 domain-containing protein [Candidatus Woesearchaeota archaeon]